MARMTFEEYIEDVLDLHIGLMSKQEIEERRRAFEAANKQEKREPADPDMKKPLAELREHTARLVAAQKRAVQKFAGTPGFTDALTAASLAIAEGEALLAAKKPTKAQFIAHKTSNSNASRMMNTAEQRAKGAAK